MSEQEENNVSKDDYSKDNYFAIIYLKGGCSNGNTKLDASDTSAWMYYIEFPSSGKSYFGNDVIPGKLKSQDTMSVEAFKNALKEIHKKKKMKNICFLLQIIQHYI